MLCAWVNNRLLVLGFCVAASISYSAGCNTNSENCTRTMTQAFDLPTPEDRCQGMRDYRECVEEDLADCPPNSHHNTDKAVQLESTHCDPVYICSQLLDKCYQNLTHQIIYSISTSDNDTRNQLCTSLEASLDSCEKKHERNCSQVLEVTRARRLGLKAACSDNGGCMSQVLQCQSSILRASAGKHSQSADQDCFNNTYIDYCGAYQEALACVNNNITACVGANSTVEGVRLSMTKTTERVCSTEKKCSEKFKACSCHISEISSLSPDSLVNSVCKSYPRFKQCLTLVETECQQEVNNSQQGAALSRPYLPYYTLLCTKDGGLCPQAIQCLNHLPSASLKAQSLNSKFAVNTLCRVAGPVFDCLGAASSECGQKPMADQANFTQIKTDFLHMCTAMSSHLDSLTTCSSYHQCMKEVDLATSPGMQQVDVIKMTYAGLAKAQFWCSYLTHGFQCMAKTAENCSLSEAVASQSLQRYHSIRSLCEGPESPSTPATGGNSSTKDEDSGGHRPNMSFWTLIGPLTLLMMTHSPRH